MFCRVMHALWRNPSVGPVHNTLPLRLVYCADDFFNILGGPGISEDLYVTNFLGKSCGLVLLTVKASDYFHGFLFNGHEGQFIACLPQNIIRLRVLMIN